MARKQAAKTKVKEADPFGDLMTAEFVEQSFKEAVADVRQRLKEEGLDCYGTVDGKRVARKPDGRIVLTPEKKQRMINRGLHGKMVMDRCRP